MGYYDGRKVPLTVWERLQLLAADYPDKYCGDPTCKCARETIQTYEGTGTLPPCRIPEGSEMPDYTTVTLADDYDDGSWR
jgi:hypothetical protein